MTPVLNHIWQSTLFAAAVYVVALALRKNSAVTRYWLWLAASLKFLVPFSILVSIGSNLEWRSAPMIAPAVQVVASQVTQPFTSAIIDFQPDRQASFPYVPILWACGTCLVLGIWTRKAYRLSAVVKDAAPASNITAPIPVRITGTLLEPGVVGFFRPTLLLPEGLVARLADGQLDAIIAHEMAHVRRRDNLAAAFHMAIEAIFWFNPLVWWIGARLIEERERACDEEVLRLGSAPETYAESILTVCKFCVQAPLPCASGVTGADLKARVLHIMANNVGDKMTFGRKLVVSAVAAGILAFPLVTGVLTSNAQANGTPKFEVASIRANNSGETGSWFRPGPSGGLKIQNVTILELIAFAYNVRDFQIEGGPGWVKSSRFDIVATPDGGHAAKSPVAGLDDNRHRLRNLLQDRFQLSARLDPRELSGYVLTVSKNGHKLKTVPENEAQNANVSLRRGMIEANAIGLDTVADGLSNVLGRKVVNETGLTGLYTLQVEWTPDATRTEDPKATNGSIFTAIQEQLGLKLTSKKVPVETVVIDSIEKPTEN